MFHSPASKGTGSAAQGTLSVCGQRGHSLRQGEDWPRHTAEVGKEPFSGDQHHWSTKWWVCPAWNMRIIADNKLLHDSSAHVCLYVTSVLVVWFFGSRTCTELRSFKWERFTKISLRELLELQQKHTKHSTPRIQLKQKKKSCYSQQQNRVWHKRTYLTTKVCPAELV